MSHLLPASDATYDLGSSTRRWRDGYLSGNLTLSSLTAGSILFAGSGGLISQDNANLFWDNVNKRLGIGTTNPAYKLDVAGTFRASQSKIGPGGFLYYYEVLNDMIDYPATLPKINSLAYKTPISIEYFDGTSWVAWSGVDTAPLTDGMYNSNFVVDYTHRKFRVTYDVGQWAEMHGWLTIVGELWFKTVSVTVEGSPDGTTWVTRATGTIPTGRHMVTMSTGWVASDRYIRITFDIPLASGEYYYITELELLTTDPYYYTPLFTSYRDRSIRMPNNLYIDGNVGIGTTAPSEKLEVAGNIRVNATASERQIKFATGLANDIGFFGRPSDNAVGMYDWATPRNVWTYFPSTGYFTILSGNIGIGTTVPATKLHVVGGKTRIESDDYAGGQLQIKAPTVAEASLGFVNPSYTYVIGTNVWGIGGEKFGIGRTDVGVRFVFDAGTGNVGIGTTSPAEKLHVAGAMRVDAGLGGAIKMYQPAGRATEMFINALGSTGALPSFGAIIRYANDGWNAIGGGLTGDNTSALEILTRASAPNTATFTKITSESGPIVFATGGVDPAPARMIIDNAGNVGIGTTTPGYKLDVAGQIAAAATDKPFVWTGFTDDRDVLSIWGGNTPVVSLVKHPYAQGFAFPSVDRFALYRRGIAGNPATDVEIFTVKGDTGNVGIGTTTPAERLHVIGNVRIDDAYKLLWSDVNLYRAAADVLKTDDNLDALALRIGGSEVITSGRVLQNVSSLNQHLTPSLDNTYDLGSASV
ncbi:MAG: hypothetical protein QXR74_07400, partial [Candidatus Bathyarchaeia archaeon]